MRLHSLALAVLLGLTLTACDSTADFEIGGTYTGSFDSTLGSENDAELTVPDTPSGGRFSFRYTLTESDGRGTDFETTVAGTGTYDHPKITLTAEDETIDGTVSEDGDTIRSTTASAPSR